MHTTDTLKVNTRDKGIIKIKTPEEIFPEYFIIRVNEFNKVAKTPLEEWIDYLKSGHIKDDTTAPGLQETRQKLQYMKMDKAERKAYDRHIDNIMVQNDVLDTAKMEGREEGRKEEKMSVAQKLKAMGLDANSIAKATGLSPDELASL